MSISDIKNPRVLRRTARHSACSALFFVIFALIYEHFSHEVYSMSMLLAFLYPLCGGTAAALLFLALPVQRVPGLLPRQLWFCGIATLTVGSVMNGVLEIYGTTNRLTRFYPAAGISLMTAAAAVYIAGLCFGRQGRSR